MGMFDRIVCQQRLPGWPIYPEVEFQTKDLDCHLTTYIISSDGRLTDERGYLVEHSGVITFYGWMTPPQGDMRYFDATFAAGRLVHLTVSGDDKVRSAYEAGYRAFQAKYAYGENPYTGPCDQESWHEGWVDAKGEKEKQDAP